MFPEPLTFVAWRERSQWVCLCRGLPCQGRDACAALGSRAAPAGPELVSSAHRAVVLGLLCLVRQREALPAPACVLCSSPAWLLVASWPHWTDLVTFPIIFPSQAQFQQKETCSHCRLAFHEPEVELGLVKRGRCPPNPLPSHPPLHSHPRETMRPALPAPSWDLQQLASDFLSESIPSYSNGKC